MNRTKLRLEKTPRASFFEGRTRGFLLGLFVYLSTVISAYFIGARTGLATTLCLLNRFLGVPCPLCGGTSASFALLGGKFSEAFLANPMVTLALPLVGLWFFLRIGLGYRTVFKVPAPLAIPCFCLLVAANWAYLISTRS